ncbi:hypothetical protein AJ78_02645 [Emergomyces pasteurianus Ep9510]|uniref:3'-5' exonuclease domain-containing protein n=1 Tax=Emergomyces pasteurianus Ep9510 TaxID=1447872 RepID=A0A1J9QM65_9EURO|nr:hypothetical protein AJ78_02645 [Emergomyces pasteurianus Ep9510]
MITSSVIDATSSLIEVIDSLDNLPTSPPSLYIDLEGIKLCREGTISILQLFNHPNEHVYLVDIHVLGEAAFTTTGTNGKSLKSILECAATPKVFFDLRNDSNALFFHFGIRLLGVEDIQLMENASRPGSAARKKFVSGLARCVELDAPVSPVVKRAWKEKKDKGLRLFLSEYGGSYEVFNLRPMPHGIIEYCVHDMFFMPLLRTLYWSKLSPEWKVEVDRATKERVRVSQTLTYQPNTRDKVLSPWQSLSNNGRSGIADNFLRRLDLFGAR